MTAIPTCFALLQACWLVAWANLRQRPTRSMMAMIGIAFSIFLMFLQLGFLDSARRVSTQIFEFFEFDLAVVARDYQFLYSTPPFDRIRLTQLATSGDVTATFNLNIAGAHWLDPRSEYRSSLLLIGIEAKPGFIAEPALRRGLAALDGDRVILADAFSHADYGDVGVGAKARIAGHEVVVAGQYALGPFFYADGSAIALDSAFARLTGRGARQISFGLVQLRPGLKPAEAARTLAASLPNDVTVLTKDELIAQEQAYFVSVKPVGMMFRSGVVIALIVGVVILFQVLSTEINNHLKEYATMKAIGFGRSFVYGLGLLQTVLFGLLAFLAAVPISHVVFAQVREASHLPMAINPPLLLSVLALTLAMSAASALITLHRVRRADPAALF